MTERCGTCVHRNAFRSAEYGRCTPNPKHPRHRADPACDQWFGMEQLDAALYGKTKKKP